jgi:glycosyltransferase involved in cell wall biosynthesis
MKVVTGLRIGYIMEANSVDMSSASGPQQHVQAVIQGLMKRGHIVRLLAFQKDRLQWTDDLMEWHSAEDAMKLNGFFHFMEKPIRFIQSRFHLPFFRFFDSIRYSRACLTVFRNFDVLYERDGTISYGGLIASRRLGIPLVLEINGDLIEEWEHMGLHFPLAQRVVIRMLTRMTYKYVTRIVSVGETLKRRLLERWRLEAAHITVVTNGADVQRFINMPQNVDVREKYSLPAGLLLAFSGGFQPWHGVDLILEGFRKALDENPDLKLILIGDGPVRADSEKIAEQLGLKGRAFFVGKVPHGDVATLLHASEVLIIYHRASAAEIVETPLKLFEYMASGKALIAPDVPNMRRLLVDQQTAVLIPPNNPVALARTIVRLAGDPELRDRLGAAAQKEAIASHTWDRVAMDLEKILDELVVNNKRLDGMPAIKA